jgi:pyrrolidone-carboxylate peptidase
LQAELSDDAGDYICNETLYLALGSDVPRVGFIHVPMPSERMSLQAMTDGIADVLRLIA